MPGLQQNQVLEGLFDAGGQGSGQHRERDSKGAEARMPGFSFPVPTFWLLCVLETNPIVSPSLGLSAHK